MKNLALIAILAALSLGGAAVANAKDTASSKAAVHALAKVPAAEMPAAAAKMVVGAPEKEQAGVMKAVIRSVAKSHPAALRHVVAAIAKADAKLAPAAAGLAARLNPEGVGAIASSACNAAPEKAAAILAVCSRATVVSNASLAEFVSQANPAFSAEVLTRESASIEVTADAAFVTGGTVILPGPPPPLTIGYTINGDPIVTPPPTAGPGTPGFDPDRYASAGF